MDSYLTIIKSNLWPWLFQSQTAELLSMELSIIIFILSSQQWPCIYVLYNVILIYTLKAMASFSM